MIAVNSNVYRVFCSALPSQITTDFGYIKISHHLNLCCALTEVISIDADSIYPNELFEQVAMRSSYVSEKIREVFGDRDDAIFAEYLFACFCSDAPSPLCLNFHKYRAVLYNLSDRPA